MIVRFLNRPDHEPIIDVEYEFGFGNARVPAKGELVLFDGSDDLAPAGSYLVDMVIFTIGIRGPKLATVYVG